MLKFQAVSDVWAKNPRGNFVDSPYFITNKSVIKSLLLVDHHPPLEAY